MTRLNIPVIVDLYTKMQRMKNVHNNFLHNYDHAQFCALFTNCRAKVKTKLFNASLEPPSGLKYEDHPGSKEISAYSLYLLCCSRSLVSGVHCDVENYLMQLYVGPCHVVSAEIAVAMAVPIENLQADEILDYLAEEEICLVELFCCTTMHVRILPGRQKPC